MEEQNEKILIDPVCDHIARVYSSLVISSCFTNLRLLGVNSAKFIDEFWKAYPEGKGNTGLNFFRFGLSHNETFNQRLGRDKDYPTFRQYIQECLKEQTPRFKHAVEYPKPYSG